MSQEQLSAFFEKLEGDSSLLEKLKAAASPEDAIAIAKESGFEITADDMMKMTSESEELSDKELESVSGGGFTMFRGYQVMKAFTNRLLRH